MRAQCRPSFYVCAAIGLLGACSTSPTGVSENDRPQLPPAATLTLMVAPSMATLKAGHTLQLTANRQDARAPSIAPEQVTWASSNVKVARIGSDGTVVGARPGTVQITARWYGIQGTATVIVLGDAPPAQPCASLSVAAVGPSAPSLRKCQAL
jgi:hypothetical protein